MPKLSSVVMVNIDRQRSQQTTSLPYSYIAYPTTCPSYAVAFMTAYVIANDHTLTLLWLFKVSVWTYRRIIGNCHFYIV